MKTDKEFDRRIILIEQCLAKYGRYLLLYLYSLTKQWQDAETLLDDLFIYALNKLPEEKLTHIGILRRRAFHMFVDFNRKKKRNPVVTVAELPDSPCATHPEEPFSLESDTKFKESFFADHPVDLKPIQKEALWLYARHGYTYKEIAKRLDKPSSTIGDWINHSRKLIADHLNEI